MRKLLLLLICSLSSIGITQDSVKLKDLEPDKEYDNIYLTKLSDDQYHSSFVIWVKNEVRLHKHEHHSENIYVISGKGEMTLGDEKFVIKKGDYFNIPKNTPHALKVLSSSPIKVLSTQSPKFVGKDRIFLDGQ